MTSFSGESKFLLRSNKLRGWNLRSFPYLSRVFILRSKQLERLSLSVYLASQISDHLLNAFAWFLNDRPQLLPNFSIFQQLNPLLTVLILHFQTFFHQNTLIKAFKKSTASWQWHHVIILIYCALCVRLKTLCLSLSTRGLIHLLPCQNWKVFN